MRERSSFFFAFFFWSSERGESPLSSNTATRHAATERVHTPPFPSPISQPFQKAASICGAAARAQPAQIALPAPKKGLVLEKTNTLSSISLADDRLAVAEEAVLGHLEVVRRRAAPDAAAL